MCGYDEKHEIIGLFLLMIVSTLYSFSMPETTVDKIENDLKIVISVEGKYNQELTFDRVPTIEEVFKNSRLKMFMALIIKPFLQQERFFI